MLTGLMVLAILFGLIAFRFMAFGFGLGFCSAFDFILAFLSWQPLSDRLVHCDQLRSIRKRTFHLQLRNHLRHTRHDIVLFEQGRPVAHEIRYRAAVTNPFEDGSRDERDGFWMVELQPA